MDFTGQFQFASGPQAYHSFMPMPLTPSHSHSAPSDEYNNNSPPDAFEGLATNNDAQFHNFDYATQSGFHQSSHHEHQHRNPGFAPGPPTPPNQPTFGQQHAHPQSTQQHAAGTGAAVANGTDGFAGNHALSSDLMSRAKSEPDDMSNDRGGSEEDNMTPAQSKRKAQNRAAYVHPLWG
jgi:AP-1-like factor